MLKSKPSWSSSLSGFEENQFSWSFDAGEILADSKEIQYLQAISMGEIRDTGKFLCCSLMKVEFSFCILFKCGQLFIYLFNFFFTTWYGSSLNIYREMYRWLNGTNSSIGCYIDQDKFTFRQPPRADIIS